MSGVILLSGLFVGAFGYQARALLRRRVLERNTWDDLLSKVEAVKNRERLVEIADLYLQPGSKQLRIEPWEMWRDVGGLSGLSRLYQNAEAMLDLAWYAERWNDENGRVITEMMRRDAARLKRSITRVSLLFLVTRGHAQIAFHLQEAIASYCLMRARLFGMYTDVHIGLVPRLSEAL